MTSDSLPLAHSYNLARLGNAGDQVAFAASDAERAAIAKWSAIVSLETFNVRVDISKLAANRFGLAFHLTADVTQSCVVTLEPVKSRMERGFSRELHFIGPARHKPVSDDSGPDLILDSLEEGPEEIESLHYDLAGPVLEEFVLALEPYPRCPGVEFSPQIDAPDRPDSPFAVLKGLK
jgi:uncharacterized metal-binding protein YceD (DUF177 family)